MNPCLVSDLKPDAEVANWKPAGNSIIYLYEDDGTIKTSEQKFETIKNPFLDAVKDGLSSGSDCFRYELWYGTHAIFEGATVTRIDTHTIDTVEYDDKLEIKWTVSDSAKVT